MAVRKKIRLRFGWIVYTTDIEILKYLRRMNYADFDDGHVSYVEDNNLTDFKKDFFSEMDYLRSLEINPHDFSMSEILVAVDGNGKICEIRHFELD